MACAVVIVLALGAWSSWQRYAAASRIAGVAAASGYAFQTMHRLRTDRSSTVRSLNLPDPIAADLQSYLKDIRDAQMSALRAAADTLESVDFAEKSSLQPELQRAVKTMTALQSETWDAMAKPKSARREGLAKEFDTEETKLLELLDKISARLVAAGKNLDSFVHPLVQSHQDPHSPRTPARHPPPALAQTPAARP